MCKVADYEKPCEMDLSHNCSLHGGMSEVCEKVPSKPISHSNGYHMHFLARNNHKFKVHNKVKETHNLNITTSSTNHRVRYGVRSELCLALQHNRGVRETFLYGFSMWLWGLRICISHGFPGEMEFFSHELTVSCPEPRSGEGRIWWRVGENPSLLENHVKCIFSHATSLILPKTNQFANNNKPTFGDNSCHFKYGIHA